MKNRGLRGLRVAYVTCSPWLVTLLFYSSQDHQPRVATYSELGTPPTHTKHQLRRCTIGLLTGRTGGDIFSLQVPFSL